MQKVALSKELGATTYPGRGIVIGRSKDGKKAVTAYFIMMAKVSVHRHLIRQSWKIRA